MKLTHLISITLGFFILTAFSTGEDKLLDKSGHINFYSHTSLEDITADNFKVTSSLNKATGELVYSVPMQGFEFKNATMQKHFNQKNFLNTKKYPKAKFIGTIDDLSKVDFVTNGTYEVSVTGKMTIKDVTMDVTETGTITVSDEGVETKTKMDLTLSDYGIKFKKGKPSTNLAKTIEVTAHVKYSN